MGDEADAIEDSYWPLDKDEDEELENESLYPGTPVRDFIQRKIDDVPDHCPICKGSMVIKPGRFGNFAACKSYPTCSGFTCSVGQHVPLGPLEKVKAKLSQPRPGALVRQHSDDPHAPIVYTDGNLRIIMEDESIRWEYWEQGKSYTLVSNDTFPKGMDAVVAAQRDLNLNGIYWFAHRLDSGELRHSHQT